VNAPPLAIVAKRVSKRISLFPYHTPNCIQYVLYKLALPEPHHLDGEYARKVDELRAGAGEQAVKARACILAYACINLHTHHQTRSSSSGGAKGETKRVSE
jgi:hypothetical protein